MLSTQGGSAIAVWRGTHFLRPRPALAFPFPLRPAGATAAAAVASAAGAAAGAATARCPAQARERSVMLGLSAKGGTSATMPRLRGQKGRQTTGSMGNRDARCPSGLQKSLPAGGHFQSLLSATPLSPRCPNAAADLQ